MMFISCILLLTLPISIGSVSTISIDSLMITQVQDAETPEEDANAYVITSTISLEGFFIDTGTTNSTTLQLISVFQQQVNSITKAPQFVFLTHGHPDHMAGIALIRQTYPSTPIYVISQQVITEAVKWVNFSCSINSYSHAQCAINYTAVLSFLTSPQTQLKFNHKSIKFDVVSVVVKAETSYAGLLGLTTSSGAYFLFTGDAITIRTHLYVSNFFENNVQPASDDALCAWAGNMQTSVCALELGNRRTTILPGHGPMSDFATFKTDVARNSQWLRVLRNLTFNSCNSTYIWAEMMRMYPDFGGTLINSRGGLTTHVPADANSVNCNCQNGSPTICPVYRKPPSCIHLDYGDSDTTLVCGIRSSVSFIWMPSMNIRFMFLLMSNSLLVLFF